MNILNLKKKKKKILANKRTSVYMAKHKCSDHNNLKFYGLGRVLILF